MGVASSRAARAEEAATSLRLDIVRGFRTSFEPGEAEAESDEPSESQALSLVIGARLPLSARWSLGARIPATTSTFLFGPREERRVTALGNVELSAAWRRAMGSFEGEIELGAALPTAAGDEYGDDTAERHRGYANLSAQRFRGYLDNALFAAHRLGVVPGGKITYTNEGVAAAAFAKLELLADAGVTKPPPELGQINETAAELVAGAQVELDPLASHVLRLGVRSWVAWTLVGEVKQPDRPAGAPPPRAQVVIDPELGLVAGRLRSSLGLIVPVGGLLGETGYLAGQLIMRIEL